MSDEFRNQLGAYMDGELHGPTLRAMQDHLETCPACQEELVALRKISETLRSSPLPAVLPPADRFADRLVRRLPPRSADQAVHPVTSAGWLVPLGLLAALIFIQATTVLNLLAALASGTGKLSDIGAWFAAGSSQTLWFSAVQEILQITLSLKAPAGLEVANNAVVSLQQWLINPLLWQSAVALVYLACLAIWWRRHQSSPAHERALN